MAVSRQLILDEGTKLFSRLGYRSTSMRDIGSACGLLAGSLYAHVQSKEQILFEITDAGTDEFLGHVRPLLDAEGTCSARLRTLVTAHIELIAKDVPRAQVVFHQWKHLTEPNRSYIKAKRQTYQNYFRAVIEDGVAQGEFRASLDAHVAVLTILGALNWLPEWYHPEGPLSADHLAEKVTDMILHGVEPVV